jgi:hypothetical protein
MQMHKKMVISSHKHAVKFSLNLFLFLYYLSYLVNNSGKNKICPLPILHESG